MWYGNTLIKLLKGGCGAQAAAAAGHGRTFPAAAPAPPVPAAGRHRSAQQAPSLPAAGSQRAGPFWGPACSFQAGTRQLTVSGQLWFRSVPEDHCFCECHQCVRHCHSSAYGFQACLHPADIGKLLDVRECESVDHRVCPKQLHLALSSVGPKSVRRRTCPCKPRCGHNMHSCLLNAGLGTDMPFTPGSDPGAHPHSPVVFDTCMPGNQRCMSHARCACQTQCSSGMHGECTDRL